MQVSSLGWEDPLLEEMATHSSRLALKIPWTEELGGQKSMESQSQARLSAHTHTHTHTPPLFCMLSTQWALLICQLWKIMLCYFI